MAAGVENEHRLSINRILPIPSVSVGIIVIGLINVESCRFPAFWTSSSNYQNHSILTSIARVSD